MSPLVPSVPNDEDGNDVPTGATGEIVINTPAPALTHAIYRATGVWHREIPITPEQIAMSMEQKEAQ